MIDPWHLFAWIAAICCSVMLIAITVNVAVALFRKQPRKPTSILGRDR